MSAFGASRRISYTVRRNLDLLTFPIHHEIQHLILNAIEELELMLRNDNVRVKEHVFLGTPELPDEMTFDLLLKRLVNSVHVLSVLIEADKLRQGPEINEDERNVITNGQKIIFELKKKIMTFISEKVEREPFMMNKRKLLKKFLLKNHLKFLKIIFLVMWLEKVKEVLHVYSLIRRAIKIIKDKRLRKIPGGEQNVQREIEVLQRLNHSNVVKVVDIFRIEEKQKLYIESVICCHSDLFCLLANRPFGDLDVLTFPILHDIQHLILNAIEELELMLRHDNVRVKDHVRLGTPTLPEEVTFQILLKRSENSVYVLCVLIEVVEFKQGPEHNKDELNAIKNGQRIIYQLEGKINSFIPEKEK